MRAASLIRPRKVTQVYLLNGVHSKAILLQIGFEKVKNWIIMLMMAMWYGISDAIEQLQMEAFPEITYTVYVRD